MNLNHPSLNDVNPAQQQAVHYQDDHLLIVAGPGTGKTHTLTQRICQLTDKLRPLEKILAITFTNKAAEEMRERLRERMSGEIKNVTVGTFHSFCLQILREHIPFTNFLKNFQVASPEQIDRWAKEIWPEQPANKRAGLLNEVRDYKTKAPEEVLPTIVSTYNQYLQEKGFVDFDDLLLEAVHLLKVRDEVHRKIQRIYRFICVDEYQDINAVQHALLKTLMGSNNVLTAIGDPNQAIYGFRGSDVRFFESFSKDFPGAVTLSLAENYRSPANLLKASGQVIAGGNKFRVPELVAKIYEKGRLVFYDAPTDKAEAEYVVHQIERLIGGTSMFSVDSGRVTPSKEVKHSFADFAVLYRLNAQRRLLEEAFNRSGIPFRVSGQKSFADEELAAYRNFEESDLEKVNLMTLHAAKGLEFPVVFIVGCEKKLIPLQLENMTSDAQEERRLFYVGMTRAKENLYLIRAQRRCLYGKTYEPLPSPFLSDIAEDLKAYEAMKQKTVKKKFPEKQMDLFGVPKR